MTDSDNQNIISRSPVVVVLGHVDHGKSSILEAIRDLKITAGESGGITQHIGAYEIDEKDKKITFIDTPGHEAFSAMRSRGAQVADIAVLVIAAEDGVKEQTKEAISHIKEAGIPMIVALNKIDKPEANPQKVKQELAGQEVLVESIGGKIPCVEISAKTGKGIPELLEIILLVAEMEDLKTDISKPAKGVVIESYLDPLRGPVATIILQEGILKKGDILGTSSAVGRVKILEDFRSSAIEKALPSMPVVVLGFENVPGIGEKIEVFGSIEEAKNRLEKFGKKLFEFADSKAGEDKKVLNLILKVDVAGSLEAIENVLKDIPQEKAVLKVLKAEVGEINESDVKLAESAGAVILGFRVKINPVAKSLILREKIRVMNFDIIYELAQSVRSILEKKLEAEIVRQDLGRVEVLVIFRTEKDRQIIGGKVKEGEARKGAFLEVFRGEEKIGKGRIVELKREKSEVGVVEKGKECGILYKGDVKIEEGDILQVYTEERKKGEL